jgi:AAA15 family ATPase/GTPase
MITKISISNFKSIRQLEMPLGRVNVLIGENGSGKSNILEAIGMIAAAKSGELKTENLISRGLRVARPDLTVNSFALKVPKNKIDISVVKNNQTVLKSSLISDNIQNIFASWEDTEMTAFYLELSKLMLKLSKKDEPINEIFNDKNLKINVPILNKIISDKVFGDDLLNFAIYNLNSNALRGITRESLREPLGIYGESLDILISSFSKDEVNELKTHKFINWLDDIILDPTDNYKALGFKLGRSNSKLYFTDKYMKKSNRLFSAENANEGALHVIFYLALLISKLTPQFFGIDNIETALNPQLCRKLMIAITELSAKHNKQVIITTHNPAILDGINLFDENQKLFVVRRADDGQTLVDQIKSKPIMKEKKYKLSELWMRGFLGGLPSENF